MSQRVASKPGRVVGAFHAPVLTGEGGSIPIVSDFERVLGAPVLLVGFSLPGANAHAPNEWLSVENFEKGTVALARLYSELSTSLQP